MKKTCMRHGLKRVFALMLAAMLCLTAFPAADAAEFNSRGHTGYVIEVNLKSDGIERKAKAADGDTVADLLFAYHITLREYDVVTPAESTVLTDGMSVTVARGEWITETVTEVIPREYIRIPNEYIPKGVENVLVPGRDGSRTVTYSILKLDGVEAKRVEEKSVVITEPATETVEYGPGGTITAPDGTTVEWSYKIDGVATAYTTERSGWKRTRSGTVARVGAIAVDPRTIPLGSVVYVEGEGWVYGVSSCEDTGGAIKGNIIDLFFNTYRECINFGRKKCTIYVISTPNI